MMIREMGRKYKNLYQITFLFARLEKEVYLQIFQMCHHRTNCNSSWIKAQLTIIVVNLLSALLKYKVIIVVQIKIITNLKIK